MWFPSKILSHTKSLTLSALPSKKGRGWEHETAHDPFIMEVDTLTTHKHKYTKCDK